MEGSDGDSSVDSNPSMHFDSIVGFLRFKKGPNSSCGEFQTSIVSYRRSYPLSILHPFLQVDLVSCVHYADKNYFTALQKELESYDCVLFESLTLRENLESGGNSTALKRLTGSPSRVFRPLDCLFRLMAGLGFQGDCLDYQAENWYHADLDEETFRQLQFDEGESIFKCARDIAVRSMKLGFLVSKLLWASHVLSTPLVGFLWASRVLSMPLVGLFVIGSAWNVASQAECPELEALYRLDFGAAMKLYLAKQLSSESTQTRFDFDDRRVVIGERNIAAMDALMKAIDEGHNKIAILYGGGHMVDLGRRLEEELSLFPCSQVRWFTAWSIRNTMARVSGWPLNGYQMVALLGLAFHLCFWKLFFGSIAKLIYRMV